MESDLIFVLNQFLSQTVDVFKEHQKVIYSVVAAIGVLVVFFRRVRVYVDNDLAMAFSRKLLGRVENHVNNPVEYRLSPVEAVGAMALVPVTLALDILLYPFTLRMQRKARCRICRQTISPTPRDLNQPHFCRTCLYGIDKHMSENSVLFAKISNLKEQVDQIDFEADLWGRIPVKCRSCDTKVDENGKLYLKDGYLHGVCDHCWRSKYFSPKVSPREKLQLHTK